LDPVAPLITGGFSYEGKRVPRLRKSPGFDLIGIFKIPIH